MLVNVMERAAHLLLPPNCVLCGQCDERQTADLCRACTEDLPRIERPCARCAEPLPHSAPRDALCGQCLRKAPRYQRSLCAFRYEYPLDHLVRALKFHSRLSHARVLGDALADAVLRTRTESLPTLLIPVPLAAARFRERGFNQASEIARSLAARLNVPLRADLIERTRNTREQTGLDAKARRRNLRGAFALVKPFKATHVALIDDVITTGSTMNELTRVLHRAGVKQVEAWAVARTPKS